MDFTLYLPATTLAAILNGGLLLVMTTSIALTRRSQKISFGDGGDGRFAKRQRGHANGVEQIPIALILIALCEVQGAPDWLLWIIVAVLTAGRFSHACQFWFATAPFAMRPYGVRLTMLAQVIAIMWLLGSVVF